LQTTIVNSFILNHQQYGFYNNHSTFYIDGHYALVRKPAAKP